MGDKQIGSVQWAVAVGRGKSEGSSQKAEKCSARCPERGRRAVGSCSVVSCQLWVVGCQLWVVGWRPCHEVLLLVSPKFSGAGLDTL